jgi:hypothetical protein
MNRLHPWPFALGTAEVLSVMYCVRALAVFLSPKATFGHFNAWFHGLDLALLKPPGGCALTMP